MYLFKIKRLLLSLITFWFLQRQLGPTLNSNSVWCLHSCLSVCGAIAVTEIIWFAWNLKKKKCFYVMRNYLYEFWCSLSKYVCPDIHKTTSINYGLWREIYLYFWCLSVCGSSSVVDSLEIWKKYLCVKPISGICFNGQKYSGKLNYCRNVSEARHWTWKVLVFVFLFACVWRNSSHKNYPIRLKFDTKWITRFWKVFENSGSDS